MESLSITLACDADLCALCPKIQKIRAEITIEQAREIYEMYKTSPEEEVKERNNRKHNGAATPSKL